jgi:Pyruvate/2-oxoacid:ferredoxin oxidoreductase delta subunit
MFFANSCYIFCKDNANERNESLLSNCRVQLFFCKDNANERNENLLSNCRVQLFFCKDNIFFEK